MFALARHQEGITLNDLEYVLDDKKDVMKFKSVKEAKRFIISKGLPPDSFGYSVFAYDLKKREIV